MERYEAYKDSGIKWIGEIPAGWGIRRIKADCTVLAGATPKSDVIEYWGGEIPWITPADYSELQHYVSEGSRSITKLGLDSCGTNLVPKGSVIVSNRAPIGLVSIAERELCTNQGCKAIVPSGSSISTEFLYWYLVTQGEALNSLGRGTTFLELSTQALGSFEYPCPSMEGQLVIADYLDAKTAEIDALVADCEREVELLREYRRAVISEAVTRGLDPDAPMKDSGVEWIGEIPDSWQVIRVKFLAKRLNVGVVINPSTYYDDSGTIPFLKGSNIQGERFDLSDVSMITDESNELLRKTQIHTNDIVMVRVGDPGRSVVVPPELDGANVASMLEVTCCDAVIPEYLCRVFNSHVSSLQVGLYTYGAAMKQINVSDLAEFYLPIPRAIEEQELMITELNRKTNEIDSFIDAKQTMAEKLREYRKSLISEAVTGKFKVPGV